MATINLYQEEVYRYADQSSNEQVNTDAAFEESWSAIALTIILTASESTLKVPTYVPVGRS
ncbi:hypothetical protein DOX71_14505 [Cronobacter sakazakii]|nr:hypothetical protein [Cronobacter sakazakii]EGT5696411.1 hypothetical protein [Cronobacter sakazakii]EGT5721219.1 hypothetical protein [Cronobacter sakazakii]EGT5725707.1 hypothetical protein [Cronobacter sakazakii]PPY54422.1 hypothetical protein C3D79_02830 [Cronobacter sakazakii]